MLAIPTLVLSLAVIAGWGFNGLYGQDPYAYFRFAVGSFRHFLLGGEPLTPIFWPLGYPFPVTLASLALGPVPLAGQWVSLIAALAAVALTYALGREVLIQAGAALPFRLRYLSPLFAPSVLAGLVLALRRYRNALPVLVLWPAVVLPFDAGLTWQNPRFALPALPPLALLAGLACAWTWGVVSSRRRFALSCFMLIAVLAVAAGGLNDTGRLVAAHQANLDVARWAAASIPAGALTPSFDITQTLPYETRLRPRDLYLLSPAQMARLVSTQPTYLLVQVGEMDGQWRFGNPGAGFRFLRHRPGLVWEGDRGSYTLFRVRRP